MIRRSVLVVSVVAGCATAEELGVAEDARPETREVAEAALDTREEEAARGDALFETEPIDSGPKGICAIPKGTTITAPSSYMSAPEMAIDGDLSTVWNSGDYTGSLRLVFPAPARFDRIRFAANAFPACDEPYTITGWIGGVPTILATATRSVTGAVEWMPVIELTPGSWEELSIEIGTSASWITMGEIDLFDSTCGK